MDYEESGRRRFLTGAASLSAAALLGTAGPICAEPPPEVKRIRLAHDIAVCIAPQYLAEEFLHLEGFTQVEWVKLPTSNALASVDSGAADMTMDATPTMVYAIDRGAKFVILGGIHAGCYELFGHENVQSVRDLKGKHVSVYDALGGSDHILLSSMLAYVGINPNSVKWVPDDQSGNAMQRFIDREVDAFWGSRHSRRSYARARLGMSLLIQRRIARGRSIFAVR